MINSSADFTGDTGNVEIRLAEGWGNLVRNDVDKTVQRKQSPTNSAYAIGPVGHGIMRR